ncbi:MAG TPA: bifunctional glutamate N-acetyltransferase/amino-acid acetyltransferase ArgJ [Ignavibacteria bacterium]
MEIEINGGVTAPNGFKAAGVHGGLKMNKKDVSLIFSEVPAVAAGVFTTNKVAAAPVIIDKEQLAKGNKISAIVCNSGIANACTGEQGLKDGWDTIRFTAEQLNISEDSVLISSTGVIGKNLFMDRLMKGISIAVKNLSKDNHTAAAEAIMTTDTFSKEYAVKFSINDSEIIIGGMAKGSGMIKPNMATMLAFITTDALISKDLLQESLKIVVNKTFNRISVDNDTSTNDMVIVLANGLSRVPEIKKHTEEYGLFLNALEKVCKTLAKMIVKDGEGATKLIEVNIKGAATPEYALKAARAVADSYLVKTAIHGADANWGRIIAAVGYSGIEFNPEKVTLKISGLNILDAGYKVVFSEKEAKEVLMKNEVKIEVDLHDGVYEETIWTSDLSKEYITINASYRS